MTTSRRGDEAAILSLVFDEGDRPSARDVEALINTEPDRPRAIRVTHSPPSEDGWLELLSSGLTFDLTGLSPARPAPLPPARQYLALPEGLGGEKLEAIALAPGPHIAAGGTMMPVVRVMMALGAQLVEMLPVKAVCWQPAGCWMDSKYFGQVIESWLFGGAFPAFGLTSLMPVEGGSFVSRGLAVFTGQEIELINREGENPADAAKLAVRLVDLLVHSPPILAPQDLGNINGESLYAEPSVNGRVLIVHRRG